LSSNLLNIFDSIVSLCFQANLKKISAKTRILGQLLSSSSDSEGGNISEDFEDSSYNDLLEDKFEAKEVSQAD